VADALIAAQGRPGHDQPPIRQNEAEELCLISEEEDEQEDDLICDGSGSGTVRHETYGPLRGCQGVNE
jgi:hypothetical protein